MTADQIRESKFFVYDMTDNNWARQVAVLKARGKYWIADLADDTTSGPCLREIKEDAAITAIMACIVGRGLRAAKAAGLKFTLDTATAS